jgi:mono/diheme cytochrome c family protein
MTTRSLLLILAAAAALAAACGGGSSPSASAPAPSAPAAAAPAPAANVGEQVYKQYCRACHMENGLGVPKLNPPLVGEWVNGDKARIINVVLKGMNGPIEVNGEKYNGVMAPHAFLSDAQVAAVLTYVRSSFGNSSGPVSEAEVAAERAKI